MSASFNLTMISLETAMTEAGIEHAPHMNVEKVKFHVLEAAELLMSLDKSSKLWSTPEVSPHIVSLGMLHKRLITGMPTPISKNNGNGTTMSTLRKTYVDEIEHPSERELGDYEDLYYLVLAKIKDISQLLSLRINNGFGSAEMVDPVGTVRVFDKLYEDGPTLPDTLHMLHTLWSYLNDATLVKTLDYSVRCDRYNMMCTDIIELYESGDITGEESDERIARLQYTFGDIPGLAWIGGWAPSMIGAWLKEKYRITLKNEEARQQQNEEEKELEYLQAEQEWVVARHQFAVDCQAEVASAESIDDIVAYHQLPEYYGTLIAPIVLSPDVEAPIHAYDRNLMTMAPAVKEYQQRLEAHVPEQALSNYMKQIRDANVALMKSEEYRLIMPTKGSS